MLLQVGSYQNHQAVLATVSINGLRQVIMIPGSSSDPRGRHLKAMIIIIFRGIRHEFESLYIFSLSSLVCCKTSHIFHYLFDMRNEIRVLINYRP